MFVHFDRASDGLAFDDGKSKAVHHQMIDLGTFAISFERDVIEHEHIRSFSKRTSQKESHLLFSFEPSLPSRILGLWRLFFLDDHGALAEIQFVETDIKPSRLKPLNRCINPD
ncbi:hypothetical protein RBSWK_03383 [Rhodopirellula baltica SWK14]|uniref:Uncharacterized protein n=1 Tax=Rhodopirellula baltica SWK14 TaxID=993516 RepID=L7CFQ9_RHOBT|nr:hypothetical protein RBSWK_03383 [Rhodopirellula baltica SWK14]